MQIIRTENMSNFNYKNALKKAQLSPLKLWWWLRSCDKHLIGNGGKTKNPCPIWHGQMAENGMQWSQWNKLKWTGKRLQTTKSLTIQRNEPCYTFPWREENDVLVINHSTKSEPMSRQRSVMSVQHIHV